MNPPTPPKGSLEDLFRHHLLESEAAAVPPRPQVWEQLDNSLLLAQNEQYRRRLRVHRWAVAASLLLAMLAGGGWWHSQQPTGSLAQATKTGPDALGPAGLAAARPSLAASRVAPAGNRASRATSPAGLAAGAAVSSPTTARAIDPSTTSSSFSTTYASAGGERARRGRPMGSAALASLATGASQRHPGSRGTAHEQEAEATSELVAATGRRGHAHQATSQYTINEALSDSSTLAYRSFAAASPAGVAAAQRSPATAAVPSLAAARPPVATELLATEGSQLATTATPAAAANALATRPTQLTLAALPGLPGSLPTLPLPEGPAPTVARRWQFGAAYATSTFQPNIDFTRESSSYNLALGTNTVAQTQSAAAEYRSNLQAGLGQRLGVWAMRRLGNGRLSLRMGLEAAQNTASSASSLAFVGQQVSYVGLAPYTVAPAQLQTTSYRYRSVSVPVELRYGNPAKAGFSLYGRLGGLLTALLNVRSEVAGNAEATRTYTPTAGSSPYRAVAGSVRGGLGMRYRPASHQWALDLGPVAEAGIMSMNTDPIQGFWSQKRPYSFGLEAGLELGRSPHVVH